MHLIEKIESCVECSNKKTPLIIVFNYGLFGEKVYMCKDCHDASYGNVYAFKQKKSKKHKHLRLVKS